MVNLPFISATAAAAAVVLFLTSPVASHPTVKQLKRQVVTTGSGCQNYIVVAGDTCNIVTAAHGITLKAFYDANPSVNAQCLNLILGSTVCIPTSGDLKVKAPAPLAVVNNFAANPATPDPVQPNTNVATSGAASSEGWTLKKVYEGANFFDGWDFHGDIIAGGVDPTHGQVFYATKADVGDLISSSAAGAVLKIEQGANKAMRRSVRIQSQLTLDTGSLLIFDADHAPAGNGLWPAFWTVGQNWPNNGEIDIMEWVNDGRLSQTSFHTGSGCFMDGTPFTGLPVGGSNCAAAETGNQGCGIKNAGLAGADFNAAKGGVFAMVWTDEGIKTFFWKRADIPADIAARAPKPSTWGTPAGFLSSSKCNPSTFFKKHNIVINTTTCGDWAGNIFGGGLAACQAYMQNNPDLSEAYWSIRSVQVYNK